MKQGKPLTREQKEALSKAGRNWKDWLSIPTDLETKFKFIHKESNQIIFVERRLR